MKLSFEEKGKSVSIRKEPLISEIYPESLQSGDLLFSGHPHCNLSQAIDLVTQTGKDTHYSHIGIMEKLNDTVGVYHATSLKGVCLEDLGHFLHPDESENIITVYRLKESYRNAIPFALKEARSLLGKGYNHDFKMTSPGYYCSEFIYRIFSQFKIFELNPMTFKNPENKNFAEHWTVYYQNLGIPIPERQPGCNPNGMATSPKLNLLGRLKC